MKLLSNLYTWLFPILIIGMVFCVTLGWTNYYISGGSIASALDYIFPSVLGDILPLITSWSMAINQIPVLNFFYWIIGAPFLYLVIVPVSFVSISVYRFIDVIYWHFADYITHVPTNLPEYEFPTSYEPISWQPVTL